MPEDSAVSEITVFHKMPQVTSSCACAERPNVYLLANSATTLKINVSAGRQSHDVVLFEWHRDEVLKAIAF